MNKISLVFPTKEYEKQVFDFLQEFIIFKSNINGVGGLNRYIDNYDAWLKKLSNDLDIKRTNSKRVPAHTYFAVREKDSKIIGMINIRHKLNEFLVEIGGHIGYCVRPSERHKGYANQILHLGIRKCKEIGLNKILLTCDKSNLASAKTIIKNGGILENEFFNEEENKRIQRYWITI